jgi:hypothetical protein
LAPRQRGPKADPQAAELTQLRCENERLKRKLQQADVIIDTQKKLAQLFGVTLDENGSPT